MNAPQSRLTSTFDHFLGESLLADAMLQWKPSSHTEQRCLTDELLTHARAAANVVANLLEHRSITIDEGGGSDITDAADLWGLADLTATLIEIISVVRRRESETAEDCEDATMSEGPHHRLCGKCRTFLAGHDEGSNPRPMRVKVAGPE